MYVVKCVCVLVFTYMRVSARSQVHNLEAIPAPSTATAKALLFPSKIAFLDAPTPKGRVVPRQEKLLNDRRLTQKAKLDLQERLEAAQLGSLLFTHGPPAALRGPLPLRGRNEDTASDNRNGARPLTARLATQRAAFDIGARRPASARPAEQSAIWRPAGQHLLVDVNSSPQLPLRSVWAKEAELQPFIESATGTPHSVLAAHREELAPDDSDEHMPEKVMLRCGVSFKCQPDPRWKDLFQATALDMKQAVELELLYVERMSTYSGKQMSRARVQLNIPRDDPDRARLVNSKPRAATSEVTAKVATSISADTAKSAKITASVKRPGNF